MRPTRSKADWQHLARERRSTDRGNQLRRALTIRGEQLAASSPTPTPSAAEAHHHDDR
jgi:hypothetical protein